MNRRDQHQGGRSSALGLGLVLLGLAAVAVLGWWSLGLEARSVDRPDRGPGDGLVDGSARSEPRGEASPRAAVAVDHGQRVGSVGSSPGAWTGRVLAADSVPLAGVAIRVGAVGAAVEEVGVGDEAASSGVDGRFAVPVAGPGVDAAHRLLLFVDPAHGAVGVPVDRAGDLGDLRLPRAGSVVGRLVGARAAGLAVRCEPVGQPGEVAAPMQAVARRVLAAVDGSFVVDRLAPGHYALSPAAPGRVLHAARCHVEVVAGERVDVGELWSVGSRDLAGTVTDPLDRPVAGAAVQLRAPGLAGWPPRSLRTDVEGGFTFVGAPELEHLSLRVEAEGYRTAELSGAEWLGPPPIRVRLDAGLAIGGVVVDAADGAPVTRFQVVAVRVAAPGGPSGFGEAAAPGGPLLQQAEDHPDGRFEVAGLEAGWYEVHVLAPGHVRGRSVAVEVGSGGRRPEVRIVVEPGLRFAGVLVLEPGGAAVGGARIRLTRRAEGEGPLLHGHALSAADGSFAVDGLRAGTYDLAVWHPDLGTEHRDELVLAASLEDQRVAVPAPAWLSGRVAGLAAGEWSRATVRAVGGGRASSADVDADGRYRLGPLPAGGYAVRAFVVPLAVHRLAEPGLVADAPPDSLSFDCLLVAGEERSFDVSVTRYPVGALQGVVRVDGMPRSGVLVGVPAVAVQVRTDAEGRYRLDDLPAGRVELRVELSGERVFVTAREVVAGASPVACDFEVGTGILRGRLVGDGWPVEPVTAVWEVGGDGAELRWNPLQVRIADGRFELPAVPAGAGRLVVPVRGARPVVREAVVPPGLVGTDLEVARD